MFNIMFNFLKNFDDNYSHVNSIPQDSARSCSDDSSMEEASTQVSLNDSIHDLS